MSIVPYNALSVRQAPDSTSAIGASPLAVNEATLMTAGQTAISVLTCQGIGGIASVALGAMSANKGKMSMKDMMNVPLDPRVAASLPQGPVEFSSEGNKFRIVLKDAAVSINGLPVVRFAVITALHGKQHWLQLLSAYTNVAQSCSLCFLFCSRCRFTSFSVWCGASRYWLDTLSTRRRIKSGEWVSWSPSVCRL